MLNPQVLTGESLRSRHTSPSYRRAEVVLTGAKLSSLYTSMLGTDLRLNQSSAGKVMRSPFSSRLASSFEDTTAPAFGCIDSLGRLPVNAGVTFDFNRCPGLITPFAACRTHTDRRRVVRRGLWNCKARSSYVKLLATEIGDCRLTDHPCRGTELDTRSPNFPKFSTTALHRKWLASCV